MKRVTIYLCMLLLLTSCYTRKSIGYLQEREDLPHYKQGEYEEYHLQVNDEIMIRLLSQKIDVTTMFSAISSQYVVMPLTYRVFEDGTVDIPFVSRIPVVGCTLKETEEIIQNRLLEFADDIQIKVTLATSTFCVIGDAKRGYFPIYKERLNIYQALALSGAINKTADFSSVKILRETPEGTVIKSFDIRTESVIESEFYYIYPNDIIYVDISKKRFWGIDSYSSFLNVITNSVVFMLTVWSFADNVQAN